MKEAFNSSNSKPVNILVGRLQTTVGIKSTASYNHIWHAGSTQTSYISLIGIWHEAVAVEFITNNLCTLWMYDNSF